MNTSHNDVFLMFCRGYLILGFIIFVAALFSGCIDESGGTADLQSRYGAAPAGMAWYQVPDENITLLIPHGWHAGLVNDSCLLVQDPDQRYRVVMQPAVFPGMNLSANNLVQKALQRLVPPGSQAPVPVTGMEYAGGDIVDMTLTLPGHGREMTVLAYAGDEEGLVLYYEYPAGDAGRFPAIARTILASVRSEMLEAGSPENETELVVHEPAVLPTALFPDFTGAVILHAPADWSSGQQQTGPCTVNWWTGDWRYYRQVFGFDRMYAFSSEDAKKAALSRVMNETGIAALQEAMLVSRTPVAGSTPADFITQVLPAVTADPGFMMYYPSLMGIKNITITGEWELSGTLKSAASDQGSGIAGYHLSFIRDGTPETGKVVVVTTPDGVNGSYAGFWGVAAPSDRYAAEEALLLRIFDSMHQDPGPGMNCPTSLLSVIAENDLGVRDGNESAGNEISWRWDHAAPQAGRFWDPVRNPGANQTAWFAGSILPLRTLSPGVSPESGN